MMRAIIRVVDVETTGLDTKNDKPVEIACTDLLIDGEAITTMMPAIAELCDPGIPIPATARAIHHIGPGDVVNKPKAELLARRALCSVPGLSNPSALPLGFAAHNADFDREILENTAGESAPWKWIDTWRFAKKLWPQFDSHKNEVLRYELFPDEAIAGVPHRAEHDVRVTARLLELELAEFNRQVGPMGLFERLDDVIEFVAAPIDLSDRPIGFGKHEKTTWREVRYKDRGYLQWMVREHNQQLEQTGTGAWDVDQWYTIQKLLGFVV